MAKTAEKSRFDPVETLASPESHPPATASARQRRCRERREAGLAVLRIEVDQVEVAEMLVRGGLLGRAEVDDRAALEAALTRQIELLTRLPA